MYQSRFFEHAHIRIGRNCDQPFHIKIKIIGDKNTLGLFSLAYLYKFTKSSCYWINLIGAAKNPWIIFESNETLKIG